MADRRWVLALVSALTLAACGGSDNNAPPAGRSLSPSPTDTAGAEVSDSFDIGGGKHLYAQCAGSGTPTVIFESGDEGNSNEWASVLPEVQAHTRACAYDRLGTGASDPPPPKSCRQLADLRRDLEALLRALGEDGPYVLVGTSGGGYLAAGFTEEHPKDVEGLVLVETHRAVILAEQSVATRAEIDCHNSKNEERRDYAAVENAAWSKRRAIGDIPISVITNRFSKQDADNVDDLRNVARQKGWLVSPQAKQVVVSSGHDVPNLEPDVVIAEVLRVLGAARRA